jgi:hypothetical protein
LVLLVVVVVVVVVVVALGRDRGSAKHSGWQSEAATRIRKGLLV